MIIKGKILDTQWLFPKDTFPKRGRAIAEESPKYTTPSFDGVILFICYIILFIIYIINTCI